MAVSYSYSSEALMPVSGESSFSSRLLASFCNAQDVPSTCTKWPQMCHHQQSSTLQQVCLKANNSDAAEYQPMVMMPEGLLYPSQFAVAMQPPEVTGDRQHGNAASCVWDMKCDKREEAAQHRRVRVDDPPTGTRVQPHPQRSMTEYTSLA